MSVDRENSCQFLAPVFVSEKWRQKPRTHKKLASLNAALSELCFMMLAAHKRKSMRRGVREVQKYIRKGEKG